MIMGDLRDYLNSINSTKEDLIVGEDDAATKMERGYPPFIINRCFSGFVDTILFANEMNKYYYLPKRVQYHFYLTAVRKKKRYSPWIKPENDENVAMLQEYFQCSSTKAKEYLSFLSSDELSTIKCKLDKGGKTNERNR